MNVSAHNPAPKICEDNHYEYQLPSAIWSRYSNGEIRILAIIFEISQSTDVKHTQEALLSLARGKMDDCVHTAVNQTRFGLVT
jgi:hypothetical protein